MTGVMPGDDGFGDTRGWDRASIAYNTRKPYRPDVSQADLLLPNEAGKLRALWFCSVSAVAMPILYVFVPLLIVNIFVPLGALFEAVLCVSLLGLIIVLFVFSVHETGQLRRLAKEL